MHVLPGRGGGVGFDVVYSVVKSGEEPFKRPDGIKSPFWALLASSILSPKHLNT